MSYMAGCLVLLSKTTGAGDFTKIQFMLIPAFIQVAYLQSYLVVQDLLLLMIDVAAVRPFVTILKSTDILNNDR